MPGVARRWRAASPPVTYGVALRAKRTQVRMLLLRAGCGARADNRVSERTLSTPSIFHSDPRSERTVVVGWDHGTYETYGTYSYGTRGLGGDFVGDYGTMGQHHVLRTTPL